MGVERVCVLAMAVMQGIVSSVLNLRYLSGGRVVMGLHLLISGDSLNVWQVVVRERDSMTVCRGEGIPKMVLEAYNLQRSNVRHLDLTVRKRCLQSMCSWTMTGWLAGICLDTTMEGCQGFF